MVFIKTSDLILAIKKSNATELVQQQDAVLYELVNDHHAPSRST